MSEVLLSILKGNPAEMPSIISRLKQLGLRKVHYDVMDGHYVPNIAGAPEGAVWVKRQNPDIFLDVHLMVERPETVWKWFAESSDAISFHPDTVRHPWRLVEEIQSAGKKCGIALNPHHVPETWKNLFEIVDFVLIMGVNPGFGGQKFLTHTLETVRKLKESVPDLLVEVDGGVNETVFSLLKKENVDWIVVGSYITTAPDPVEAYRKLLGGGKDV